MSMLEPEILDVVDAPENTDCELWNGGGSSGPCDASAVFLFVYNSNADPDGPVHPKNALACQDCFSPPSSVDRTGPEPEDDDTSGEQGE